MEALIFILALITLLIIGAILDATQERREERRELNRMAMQSRRNTLNGIRRPNTRWNGAQMYRKGGIRK